MKKKGTRFFNPETITELKEIIEREGDARLLAGGTSMFRTINGDNLLVPGAIMVLDNIKELKRESRTDRYFEFGSMLTIQQIIDSSKKNLPPVLLEALIASSPYPVRNIATIGGLISDKKIVSDLIPMLLIFNCKIEVINLNEKRIRTKWVSLMQYISDIEEDSFQLMTRIRIPLLTPAYYQYYKTGHKYNLFNEISFSAVTEMEKNTISSLSMVFNIENREIVRLREVEAELAGKMIPVNHKLRETIIQDIENSLDKYDNITPSHKFRIAEIILHFLDGF